MIAMRLIFAALTLLGMVNSGAASSISAINMLNPQERVQAQIGHPHVYDDFHRWRCSEWGHAVPCGNHMAVTRAAIAWCPTRGGLIRSVASGFPCFTDQGLWINQLGFINGIEYARDLTQTIWSKAGMTVAETATGADGTPNSATLVTGSGTVGTCTATCTVLQTCTVGVCTSTTFELQFRIQAVTVTGAINATLDGGATWTALTSANCKKNDNTASGLITDQYVNCFLSQSLATPVFGLQIINLNDAVNVDFFTSARSAVGVNPGMPCVTTTATCTTVADNIATAGQLLADMNNSAASMILQGQAGPLGETTIGFATASNKPVVGGTGTSSRIEGAATTLSVTNGGGQNWSSASGVMSARGWDAGGIEISAGGAATTTNAAVMVNAATSYLGGVNGGNLNPGPIGTLAIYPGFKLPTGTVSGLSGLPSGWFQ